jgi:hypothetical protein
MLLMPNVQSVGPRTFGCEVLRIERNSAMKLRRMNRGYLQARAWRSGVLTAMLMACSGQEGMDLGAGGGPGNEPVAGTTEAITSCGCNSSSYTFVETGVSEEFVGPLSSTHICWPTAYYGHPTTRDSPNYRVVRDGNGNWVSQNFGAMGCVPQCCFYSNGGSADVRWISGDHSVSATDSTSGNGAVGAVTRMWKSDAMPILSGGIHTGTQMISQEYIGADFFRAPDTGAVYPPGLAFITTVASWSTTTVTTTGLGYSFFVGRPNTNHKVKMKDYFLNTSGPISMISDSAGICTINNLQRIKRTRHPVIYTEGGVWKAELGGTGTIGAMGIRCFYFNQDQ